jgi:hypothetical protein
MTVMDYTVTAAEIQVGWQVNNDTSWHRITVEWVRHADIFTCFAGYVTAAGGIQIPMVKTWDSSSPIIAHYTEERK